MARQCTGASLRWLWWRYAAVPLCRACCPHEGPLTTCLGRAECGRDVTGGGRGSGRRDVTGGAGPREGDVTGGQDGWVWRRRVGGARRAWGAGARRGSAHARPRRGLPAQSLAGRRSGHIGGAAGQAAGRGGAAETLTAHSYDTSSPRCFLTQDAPHLPPSGLRTLAVSSL